MKKGKIYFASVLFIFLFIGVLGIVFIGRYSYAATDSDSSSDLVSTTYADFSSINELDSGYQDSVVFLTEESEFIELKKVDVTTDSAGGGTIGNIKLPNRYILKKKTSELTLLITKCAKDANGNLLDVVITLDNVNIWKNTTAKDSAKYARLTFFSVYNLLVSQNDISKSQNVKISTYQPLRIGLGVKDTNVDFTITYYKTGVSKQLVDGKVEGTLADVSKINAIYNDLDVAIAGSAREKDKSKYKDKLLSGEEGLIPLNGSSTIYYNKETKGSGDKNNIILQELDNGIATKKNIGTTKNRADTNAAWYKSSAFVTTSVLNSSYKFRYGGAGCGIMFMFASIYPYGISSPVLSINDQKEEYHIGESFVYNIKQSVSDNSFINSYNFKEIYDNFSSNGNYISFKIQDEFSSYLNLSTELITINDELGSDVTNLFDITLEEKLLTITPKTDFITAPNFSKHNYSINVPVTINSEGVDAKELKNKAISNINEKIQESNEITTNVYYNFTVKYIEKETNNELAPSVVEKKYFGDEYASKANPSIDLGYVLISEPENSEGVIGNSDVEVIYYYKAMERVANIYAIDESSNQSVIGGEYVIYDSNNNKVAKLTTSNSSSTCNLAIVDEKEGCSVYESLKPNETYKVVEEKTPVGYATMDPVTFTTDEYGLYNEGIVLTNTPIKVCISVEDASSNRLSGISINMRNAESEVYQTFISTYDEQCYTEVPEGLYALQVSKVIDGYKLPENVSIEVTNNPSTQSFKVIIPKQEKSNISIIIIIIIIILIIIIIIVLLILRKKLPNNNEENVSYSEEIRM